MSSKLSWDPIAQVGSGAGTVQPSYVNGQYPIPVVSAQLQVVITLGGILGAASAKVSLDGGATFGAPFTIPNGIHVLPGTGIQLTFNFAAGAFETNDVYSSFMNAGDITLALQRASGRVEGYLRSKFDSLLPLGAPNPPPGDDIIQVTADIAAYFLQKSEGFNPQLGADNIYVDAYDKAIAWLKDVAQGRAIPQGLNPNVNPSTPQAASPAPINSDGNQTREWDALPARGWGSGSSGGGGGGSFFG